MRTVARRKQLEGLENERQCWKLYVVDKMTVPQIAEQLGINKGTVSRRLQRAESRVIEQQTDSANKQRAIVLSELWSLYKDAREAWWQSIGEHKKNKTKVIKGKEGGDVTQAEVASERKVGDARFLEAARSILADVRKMQGYDMPTKIQQVETNRPFEDLTEDQLRAEFVATLKAAGVSLADLSTSEVKH
jgi:AcrR family transcriptional regulator